MTKLTVSLVTPRRFVANREVDQVTAPSVEGEVGILPQHLPLLADLHEGVVGLYKGLEVDYYAVSGGFVEVNDDVVTVLAETAEHSDEIDRKRAQRALDDAEARLKGLNYGEPEYAEQDARAKRARVRLYVKSLAAH